MLDQNFAASHCEVRNYNRKVIRAHEETLVLSTRRDSAAEVILDYGAAQQGRPVYEISSVSAGGSDVSGPIQFEATFSETYSGIESEDGDGPFMLFSNAMDSYRTVKYLAQPGETRQTIKGRHVQYSQRYQRVRLLSSDASITFAAIRFDPVRHETKRPSYFRCSDPLLNRIWEQGARTVDGCTVRAGETLPAWDVTSSGTTVYGQHWAPCRRGTRWKDQVIRFDVRIDETGASWGVHMVANGLILCLDKVRRVLAAFEGLAHESNVFPTTPRGIWSLDRWIFRSEWLSVETRLSGSTVVVSIQGDSVAKIEDLELHPLLGGSDMNSGSIAFGGPAGWIATYRHLHVHDGMGQILYTNSLLPHDKERTLEDFAVGTNRLAGLIDGAKRDRAVFGGDLYISGRSVAYSSADLEAIRGSIQLLTSHCTRDGYLGNLCPIQAPLHTSGSDCPTYAFYSLTYALLLVVAIKDYWLHSGDCDFVEICWSKLERLLSFAGEFMNDNGLIAAPPPLSLTFFPLGGPVFGVSSEINLAYLDALQSMGAMAISDKEAQKFAARAADLKSSITEHLWSRETGILRMSDQTPSSGLCTHVNAYAAILDALPSHPRNQVNLTLPNERFLPAFQGLEHWDKFGLCSPFSATFSVEACFKRGDGAAARDLIGRVWSGMTDDRGPDYSGGLWEAMTLDGSPFTRDTSLVHAWSSGPVFLMPMYLAGLRPLKAGWREWEARPVHADLSEVEASILTPFGSLRIRWRFDSDHGQSGAVEVEAPSGVSGQLHAPEGWMLQSADSASMPSGEGIQIGPGHTKMGLSRGRQIKMSSNL